MSRYSFIRTIIVAAIGVVVGIYVVARHSWAFPADADALGRGNMPGLVRNTSWVRLTGVRTLKESPFLIKINRTAENATGILVFGEDKENCGEILLPGSMSASNVDTGDIAGRFFIVDDTSILDKTQKIFGLKMRYIIDTTTPRFTTWSFIGMAVVIWGLFQVRLAWKLYKRPQRQAVVVPPEMKAEAGIETDTPLPEQEESGGEAVDDR